MNWKIFASLFLVIVLLSGLYATYNYRTTGKFTIVPQKTSSISNLKKLKEEAKNKFDLDGKITNVDLKSKTFDVQVEGGSKAVSDKKSQTLKIYISDKAEIMDQAAGESKIETIQKDKPVNIKGTIKNNKYWGELILLNPINQ